MSHPFRVSQSKIKMWRRCQYAYNYRYKRNLEKKKLPRPLLRGRVVHEMIEAHIKGDDPWVPWHAMVKKYKKLFQEEQEIYGDLPNELKLLMDGYFKWYSKDPIRYIKLIKGGPKVEHKFEVMLDDDIILAGRIDGVGRTKDKRTWLVEHKSHKQIPESGYAYTDIQAALYLWAIQRLTKIEIDGVLWNYIRVKTPAIPQLLQKGGLSRRNNIDTTWPIYRKAILDEGLKLSDYKDMKAQLIGRESRFYIRSLLPVNKAIISNVVREARITARQIRDTPDDELVRNIDKHCSWCEFRGLCQAQYQGLDDTFILKTEYRKKKASDGTKDEEILTDQED